MENINHFNKWGVLAVNGLIAVLFGALVIFVPGATLLTVVTYLGIVVLILGLAMLVGVILNIKNHLSYATDLIETIILLVIGFFLTFYSKDSLEVFVIIVGSWAIFLAILQFIFAFKVTSELKSKNTLIISSVISLIFGILLFTNPFKAAEALVVIAGIISLIIGVILIILALKMKNFFSHLE